MAQVLVVVRSGGGRIKEVRQIDPRKARGIVAEVHSSAWTKVPQYSGVSESTAPTRQSRKGWLCRAALKNRTETCWKSSRRHQFR